MSSEKENKTAGLILCAICVLLLAGGIPLAVSAEMYGANVVPEDEWKLVLGTMMAAFGGIGLLSFLALFAYSCRGEGYLRDFFNALNDKRLSKGLYLSIRKKERIILAIVTVLAVVLLILWFNTFSLLLAAGMILGAIGALILLADGKFALLAAGFIEGVIAGLAVSFLPSPPVENARYAVFINHVKVREFDAAKNNRIGAVIGCAIIAFILVMLVAYLITIICALTTKDKEAEAEKTDQAYLNGLIHECNELRKNTAYNKLKTKTMKVFYIAKKNQELIGYLQGYYELSRRKQYKITERDSVRSDCKKYLKIYRDETGTIKQIENYVNGKIDVIHQSFEADNKTFLFPFTESGSSYPTYSYVTVRSDKGISEEYMVDRTQIIYMKYEPTGKDNEIGYSSVNYIEGGKIPVLEKRKGIIDLDTLQYEEKDYSSWLEN